MTTRNKVRLEEQGILWMLLLWWWSIAHSSLIPRKKK